MAIRSKQKISPSFSMSSMTDLVFLLLLFFILTSTLVSINALDIQLPSASSNQVENQITAVSIHENGEFSINDEKVDAESLENSILLTLESAEERNLVIRSDKNAKVDYLVQVMDIAKRNNIKVVIATEIIRE
jgi:biopolymer transport protein ExbD